MEKNSTAVSTVNALSLKTRRSISGCRTRRSYATNTPSTARPPAMQIHVAALSQPQDHAC